MDPVEEQLARLRQNPGNWPARAELAHLWRERGVHFDDHQLLSGAVGAPHNRSQLQHLLDALEGPPTMPDWAPVLDEYLRWAPGCPLGLSSLAHVVEAIGKTDEALELYQRAVEIDPSVAEPPLACLRKEEKKAPVLQEDESPRKLIEDSRFQSFLVAISVHIFLIILLSLWAVSSPGLRPPQLVAHSPQEDVAENPQNKFEKKAFSPTANTSSMQINSAPISANMAVSLSAPSTSPSVPLMTGSFNPSMSFSDGGGGSVSFFGSRGKTKKMVYVVDVSGSMQQQGEGGKTRHALMREELKRSVSALPFSVRYQIIFFNNSAWFAGQEPGGNGILRPEDPESLPTKALVRATQSQKRKMLEHIDNVRIGGGTNWRLPLKMAIKLEPDLIYFMTDGEIDSDSGEIPVIEDVVNYNRKKSRAKINTICLMELKAYDKLQDIARRTSGTVFLVKEDGSVIRGLALDQLKK